MEHSSSIFFLAIPFILLAAFGVGFRKTLADFFAFALSGRIVGDASGASVSVPFFVGLLRFGAFVGFIITFAFFVFSLVSVVSPSFFAVFFPAPFAG